MTKKQGEYNMWSHFASTIKKNLKKKKAKKKSCCCK